MTPGAGLYPDGVNAAGRPHAIGSLGLAVVRDDQSTLLTAAHVVGALSEAANGDGRIMYVAGFGGASSQDRYIGDVVVSDPADAETTDVQLDAALVDPADNVFCRNVVRHNATSCIARDVEETADEDNPVIVHKRGWATGSTSGLLVPVPEALEVEGRMPDGSTVVREYLRGYFVYGDDCPFAKPGDSGSIVVDDDECVVGMVVALRANKPDNVQAEDPAFVVPILDIIDGLGIVLAGPSRQCTLV